MVKQGWQVQQIDVAPDSGAVVTMVQGSLKARLRAPDFGVGRAGKRRPWRSSPPRAAWAK